MRSLFVLPTLVSTMFLFTACGAQYQKSGDPIPKLSRSDDPGAAQAGSWGDSSIDLSQALLVVDLQQDYDAVGRVDQASMPFCLSTPGDDFVLGRGVCEDDGQTYSVQGKHVRWVCGANPQFILDPKEQLPSCNHATVQHDSFNFKLTFTSVHR